MEKISQWCAVISAVSIFTGIIYDLMPDSAHRKTFKTAATIIMLFVFVQLFSRGDMPVINFTDYLSENYSVSRQVDKDTEQAVIATAEDTLTDTINNYLRSISDDYSCRCKCSITEEKLQIAEVIIFGSVPESDKVAISKYISGLSDTKTTVIFKGEGYEQGGT